MKIVSLPKLLNNFFFQFFAKNHLFENADVYSSYTWFNFLLEYRVNLKTKASKRIWKKSTSLRQVHTHTRCMRIKVIKVVVCT